MDWMLQQTSKSTRFGWIVDGGDAIRPPQDVCILENDHFVALPSLGSLVLGWLVVVPRRPIPNLSQLNSQEREKLTAFARNLVAQLSTIPGEVYAFEHGGSYASSMSCGVEQAHLHLVPLGFDLFEAASAEQEVVWITSRTEMFSTEDKSRSEYLWVRAPDGRTAMGRPSLPRSQWFRRLIARELNRSEEWDYRAFPFLSMISETAAAIGNVDDGGR